MPYLFDTHTFLWWITDDPRLSPRVRGIVGDPTNEIYFSAASAWEIGIKGRLGRIEFQDDPTELIPRQVAAGGFASLPIETRHALEVLRLPLLHGDPFDRLLIAQALVEDLTLLSADPTLSQYHVPVVW